MEWYDSLPWILQVSAHHSVSASEAMSNGICLTLRKRLCEKPEFPVEGTSTIA
jgi:hypothetical protein